MSFINFVILMDPLGYTWEEYERRKHNMVGVTRWHAYWGGDIEKAWTKILTYEDATMRFGALRRKGWRKVHSSAHNTGRTRPTKKNPVRGEWWITDGGEALYADVDVGDMGHEAYVIDSVTRTLLNAMDIDADEAGSLDNWTKNIKARMEEDEFAGDQDEYIEEAAKSVWKDKEQRDEAIRIAWGSGDARKYSMQYDGWKRVQGHNIETWELIQSDLKDITNGLYDASGDDLVDEDEFNIYVFSTGVWYENVPWSVLQEDDPGKLRPYAELKRNPPQGFSLNPVEGAKQLSKKYGAQAMGWARTFASMCKGKGDRQYWMAVYNTLSLRTNPPRVLSYAEAHKWEPLAKAKGVSEVARSSRGFMRMYEKAGTWDNVNDYWRKRRAAFIARHMAQVRQNGEKLWKPDKSGKLRPSRRALALLMWAFYPPRNFS